MRCSTRRVQLALLALCLGLCGHKAHGWIPRRGRGQAQLTPMAAGNRHLKSHPHASGGGLPHQEAYHSRYTCWLPSNSPFHICDAHKSCQAQQQATVLG